jgi:hypothetical protein
MPPICERCGKPCHMIYSATGTSPNNIERKAWNEARPGPLSGRTDIHWLCASCVDEISAKLRG